jgi:hypothetical protein
MKGRWGRAAAATFALLVLAGQAPLGADSLSYRLRAGAIVLDADKAARAITGWAEEAGGYFLRRSSESVVFRVPAARFGEVRALVASVAEVIVSYEPSATDVREQLSAAESGIRSREEALSLILGYLGQADVAGTLALEREVAGLMSDIETLQGKKRRLENDAAFALVEVSLSSRRQTVPTQRPSSFAWVNSVDLYRFVREVLSYER